MQVARVEPPIHAAIAEINPGDALQFRADLQNRYQICTASGEIIGRTSASFQLALDDITASVAGIVVRFSSDMNQQSLVDVLPSLKKGDSYGVQATT